MSECINCGMNSAVTYSDNEDKIRPATGYQKVGVFL